MPVCRNLRSSAVLALLPLALGACGRAPATGELAAAGYADLTAANVPLLSPPAVEHTPDELKSLDCSRYAQTFARDFQGAASLEEVRQTIESDLASYALSIRFRGPWFSSGSGFSFDPLTEADLPSARKFGATLVDSWRKATVTWVAESRLRNIVLVKNLVVAGQHRTAMPDDGSHTLYYDAGALSACMASDEEVIHHEYYHLVESAQFGSMYYRDPAWATFNAPGFTYGGGGAAAYTSGSRYSATEHPAPGLVDQYASFGLEEDKAEIYAWSLTPPLDQKLLDWTRTDPLLARKLGYMNAFIRAHSAP